MRTLSFLIALIALSSLAADDESRPLATDELVFTATLQEQRHGPVGQSAPPLHTFSLDLRLDEVLRGRLSPGDSHTFQYNERTRHPTEFQPQASYMVSARQIGDRKEILNIRPLENVDVDLFREQAALPPGWSMDEDRPLSPWASLPRAQWPDETKAPACATTGRPFLPLPEEVEFLVTPLPPQQEIEGLNPDGDGRFQLTLLNPTNSPLEVPALLSRDGEPLWQESLILQVQHRAYPAPRAQGDWHNTTPTLIPPNDNITGEINAIALNGPDWPRGGSRVLIGFVLGDRIQTHSFYYHSRHHAPLRSHP